MLALLVVVVLAALWMIYLYRSDWFGGINISGDNLNPGTAANGSMPKDINGQLDNLRQNVKNLQDKKDQEIMNELK